MGSATLLRGKTAGRYWDVGHAPFDEKNRHGWQRGMADTQVSFMIGGISL